MNSLVLALLFANSKASAAGVVGTPCTKQADCNDPSMCCGVGTGGMINQSSGIPSAVPVTEHLAYCNKDPATDGNPPS